MPPIIQARGLTKRYGAFTAVAGIDFAVEEGEFFALLGPNGAGKTTAIRMITCVLPATAGSLTVDGLDTRTHDREIKARLGVVSQDDNLDSDLTVRKNLEVYARYFDVPAALARERIDDGLRLMQLEDWAKARIHALSGGMKRRLVIARALVNAPRILVLDEPTTGLDPQARHLVWRRLRLLRERGVTVLLTSHYMDEAEYLCDRLVIMDHGRILDQGAPRALIQRHVGGDVLELHFAPREQEAARARLAPLLSDGARAEWVEDVLYVHGLNDSQSREVGAWVSELVGAGDRARPRPANLEDVFLTLTGRGLQEGAR